MEIKKEKSRILEKVNHETAARPFSIHHTYVGGDNTNALYLHCHPEAEFFYLEEGNVTLYVEEREVELGSGDAVFIPPNQTHHADKAPGISCSYSAIVFSLNWFSGYLGGEENLYVNMLLRNPEECTCIFRKDCREHADTLSRLANLRGYMGEPIERYEMRLLGELMISLQEIVNAVSGKMRYNDKVCAAREGVRKGIDYLMLHFDEGVTLSELVECSGYSESHFCHRFKSITGYTPFAYLNRIRVIKAAERLIVSDDRITEIAMNCGFENISYFNRVFRKQMGMSPGEYRVNGKQHRQESSTGKRGNDHEQI